MGIISVDLGTTNIKVAAYTNQLKNLVIKSHGVAYIKENSFIEFDAEMYFSDVITLITDCYSEAGFVNSEETQIVLTGQAESLVVLGKNGKPIINGISWLDMRSEEECILLSEKFDKDLYYKITGQPEIIPTWPITKILWIKKNQPDVFNQVDKFSMIKDYIIYRLTGRFVGEYSIYPFSSYFDVINKKYWTDILDYCGVDIKQLPELIEPCSVVGRIHKGISDSSILPPSTTVNAGTLDHFAGMIGTGNITQGSMSESAGTVSSLATFVKRPEFKYKLPFYCGPFRDSYIYLPVSESGGISLEWFKETFLPDKSFFEIDTVCKTREIDPNLIFLPYLTGVNPPEFNPNATGVFYGANINHDAYDFAISIMSGVAALTRKNIEYFIFSGIDVDRIISTGGGAKSSFWSQLKADICNLPVDIPNDQEAPSLGSAIISAVTMGVFKDYENAINSAVGMNLTYYPNQNRADFEKYYENFVEIYDKLFSK